MSTDPHIWDPLLQHRHVPNLITQRILTLISTNQLRPGDRLPSERELATMLGASRPSVREALRSLSAQGRVHIRHGAGVFVTEPAVTRDLRGALLHQEMSLRELFDMREVLEMPAAGWAARNRDAGRLAMVSTAWEALQTASLEAVTDWRRLQELDAAFHMRIVEASGNRFLPRTLGVLQEMLAQSMQTTLQLPGRLEKSRQDHQRILDALLAGDAAAARRAAAKHIRAARRAAFARLPARAI